MKIDNKNAWIYGVVILILIFIISAVFFRIYAVDILAEQFYGALLGVVITSIITLLLLKGQTSNEELKEQNIKIFEKKSEIFSLFINDLWEIWKRKSISMEGIINLVGRVSKEIIPYAKPESSNQILGYIDAIAERINKEDLPHKIDENVLNIINVLSKEIGLGGEINAEIRAKIKSLEDKVMPFFNKQENIKRINDGIEKLTKGNIHSFLEEANALWWRIGENTGVWLRIGLWGTNIYLAFWSDFSNYQYHPYRYKVRGKDKDFLYIYSQLQALTQTEFEELLQGKVMDTHKLEKLVEEIDNFYHNIGYQNQLEGKTIQEIINEVK